MKFTTIILSSFCTVLEGPTRLIGQVVIDDFPIADCRVQIVQNGMQQSTDRDGRFRLSIEGLNKVTLKVSYNDSLVGKTVIREIQLDKNENDLGVVPIFFNRTISISDYEMLPVAEKKRYKEIRHWVQLIGYMKRNEVDGAVVRTKLWDNRGIKYQIDTLDNAVVVNYRDWSW